MSSTIDMAPPSTTAPSSPFSVQKSPVKLLARNVDAVVLGNVLFETWYYSPYPDSVILSSQVSADDYLSDGLHSAPSPRSASIRSATCSRLYVCPYCFRYTPGSIPYISHLRHHQSLRQQDPHVLPVPQSSIKVYEHDGYAVWEIDGEKEKLYCQNLSLFGKLFLEQKSVFFDTGGFLYYVLTYTPPAVPTTHQRGRPPRKRAATDAAEELGLKTQVLGFFSKENPSWDSNNLACILIFPPFQHRRLGKLLMSVSYKLSGWEWEGGAIGGPEKPLSKMGRRSYLRFWAERVARFMLGKSADADGRRVFDRQRKRKVQPKREEMTVKEIGERTGMLAEDVMAALTEMGVCELVALKTKKVKSAESDRSGKIEEDDVVEMIVRRSKINEWAEGAGVDLEDPVREEGFLGEWAMSEVDAEADEEIVDEEHSQYDEEAQ